MAAFSDQTETSPSQRTTSLLPKHERDPSRLKAYPIPLEHRLSHGISVLEFGGIWVWGDGGAWFWLMTRFIP
eukprot:gene5014-10032_t